MLLGRNSAYILRDWPNVFNVWLDGPEPARVNRAAEASDLASEMAAVQLRFEDELRVSMSVFGYGYDPRNLEYYDLVVNTCRLDVEDAAQVIAAAARAHAAGRLNQ
ncbi:MAG: cytidylate kinase family protein [Brooklawnia sp.]|uniref:cytidylate kinase-like family protein n=1 Tax=Brooklawnia sp. TaxID=2699740 RepID=UPI003C724A7D